MDKNKILTIEETFILALKNHQKGKTDVAQGLYNQVLKINPYHLSALNNIAVIFTNLKEYKKAKECCEKAIEINPNYADAHYNLGLIFHNLKDSQRAKACYEKTIEINPNFIAALNNLGVIFEELEEPQKAISYYERVTKFDPNYLESINGLYTLLRRYGSTFVDKNHLKNICLFLFKKNNISHNDISHNAQESLLTDKYENQIKEVINSESSLLTNQFVHNLLNEELFHLILQKSFITDKFLEKLLTKLRCEILFELNNNKLKEYFDFIISFAEQCWLNEFIYTDSEEEISKINKLKNKIEESNEINEIEIAILGCYIPLNESIIITNKLFYYKSTNILFNDLITIQIKEPLKEKELKKLIKSVYKINDFVSKRVQEQYEEHPYPRWRHTNKFLSKTFINSLNEEIASNKIIYNNKFNNPNVLIAGCGTGSHPISATKYQNTNILAVDLSKSSLAYAKRKTEELGLKNIEYIHADILQLNKLNKKFDIIESSGVLHHMKDPIVGLKVLLDILEPHGFLKLGLYSKIARQHVVKARELIKEKNYKNTTKDIKNFRQDILDKKVDPLIQKVSTFSDFYSTSMMRDLLFHVQEHRFTIPQISEILKDQNLEFLGFFNLNPLIKKKIFERFS